MVPCGTCPQVCLTMFKAGGLNHSVLQGHMSVNHVIRTSPTGLLAAKLLCGTLLTHSIPAYSYIVQFAPLGVRSLHQHASDLTQGSILSPGSSTTFQWSLQLPLQPNTNTTNTPSLTTVLKLSNSEQPLQRSRSMNHATSQQARLLGHTRCPAAALHQQC